MCRGDEKKKTKYGESGGEEALGRATGSNISDGRANGNALHSIHMQALRTSMIS